MSASEQTNLRSNGGANAGYMEDDKERHISTGQKNQGFQMDKM